ncbi:hypothetical protein BDD12DRAFT_234494 [Trichophaea hybrida]|nr:hypothetical protein BDD12DRAFT_234494 [Trichophaea hybrida]
MPAKLVFYSTRFRTRTRRLQHRYLVFLAPGKLTIRLLYIRLILAMVSTARIYDRDLLGQDSPAMAYRSVVGASLGGISVASM